MQLFTLLWRENDLKRRPLLFGHCPLLEIAVIRQMKDFEMTRVYRAYPRQPAASSWLLTYGTIPDGTAAVALLPCAFTR